MNRWYWVCCMRDQSIEIMTPDGKVYQSFAPDSALNQRRWEEADFIIAQKNKEAGLPVN